MTGRPINKVLTNIEIIDILFEPRFGSSTFNNDTTPAPIIIAKSSENITIPKAILMLFF